MDFGMKDRQLTIPVRRALLYYFLKRLRLDVADRLDDPQETPVIVQNKADLERAFVGAPR